MKRDKTNNNTTTTTAPVDQASAPAPQSKVVEPVRVALYDGVGQKQALDDAIVRYFTSELSYEQVHTINYIKVLLGLVGCILAGLAQFYPEPFPKNKPVLIICVLLYMLISLALYYIAQFVQKDTILFGRAKESGNSDFRISTSLPRFEPNYTIKYESGKDIVHSVTKPINNYFNTSGLLVEAPLFKDLHKLHEKAITKKSK
ncbi:hypothetical protein SAMD00019534_054640 [Acytostelium subglobosum LB1]|uniref:hypothetical protein n=1 Tax=Acytostelium subglobosum LB1 TaxID=1410327 RepID=UPI000644BAC5|nr:hypothetical protein SAMD00019534_054640 [Acytostelium subglobosum LB1]GAM22289.1 hypothetical protein SAMD00019534_054640 [Acytostelium subglobosum LB1]|eukprot:XP_012754409.1 hypothetical protein SAMD00019534_054640 [Acytostelium subglobosum LB1]